ncbi:Cytochrome c [Lacipirellula limnantheis]|uniref:Cytochrome c n=2 Tax=Lacipirellula limnantheis TaxID=2528024 RepID=A0A517TZ37_9BACT|nr:Cytochrome c [Lacipirellula limnantheis]
MSLARVSSYFGPHEQRFPLLLLSLTFALACGCPFVQITAAADQAVPPVRSPVGVKFPVPQMTSLPAGPPPFDYVEVGAKIPNYVASETWGTQGAPLTTMQKPLASEQSLTRMVVPVGFHVELFAAEPDLGGKPLCMTWDERGRLWLGESIDYPNELQPPGQGRDRIRICEDTDGDGRADKFIVFAEGLSIPTSISLTRGGAIVHTGTETLFLRDVDGDDRADERRTLLAGWTIGDTHGGASNMQYGLDNWIWGMQGYNKSTIRLGDKEVTFAQGFHRFRPDGSDFEFVRSTNNNTWGLGVSEEGIVFGSTANGNPSEYLPIPNRYYERVRGWTPQLTLAGIADSNRIQPITKKVRQVDHHGGHTAAAGHALYTARAYPPEYWNRTAFVCEPTGHLVGTFVLRADGAGFRSASPFNLLASDDEWTAPTMAEVGPDGCVWVIDWYNYIVQHNPTPAGFVTGKGAAYESDLRDKLHGRVYRIVYDAAPPAQRLNLSQASPQELVATLANDNLFWRRHAQRLLVERGKQDVVRQLLELVDDQSVDALDLNVGAIHALWTLHGLGAIHAKNPVVLAAVTAALRHPAAGVRRNAVQVLPTAEDSTEAILAAGLLQDAAPQVRLQSLLTLSNQQSSDEAGLAIFEFVANAENAADRWLLDAATCAAAAHAAPYLTSAAGRTSSDEQQQVARTVANHLARTSVAANVTRVLASLADADPQFAGAAIMGLQEGWPPTSALWLDDHAPEAIERLRERMTLESQVRLAQLLASGGAAAALPRLDALIDALCKQAENGEVAVAARAEAARLAVAAQPDDVAVAQRLLALLTPQTPPELGVALFQALQDSRTPTLGPAVIERAVMLAPSLRQSMLDLLLSRSELTTDLLDAIDQGAIQASELSLIHKQRLIAHPSEQLRERARALLARSRDNISSDRAQVLAELASVAQVVGDAANGKAIFAKSCAVCHKLRGEGAAIGPDLSGMAVHGKEQLLVHLLDPNRDVEGNYVSYVAQLVDGVVISGMLAGESAASIELVDAKGIRHAILREDIEQFIRSGTSLMPEGFEKQLSRVELGDLLEYLAARTRFVPLDLLRVATISSAQGMFNSLDAEEERLVFADWGEKQVDGVPFYPIDPQAGRIRNVVMLHGDHGTTPPTMPASVELPCGVAAKAIHFLGGVSGWGFPATEAGSQSMIVRLHYADGETEDHALLNGVHFADYLGDANVPQSKLAFSLGRQQVRYLKVEPQHGAPIDRVELIKGSDATAPIVMAITVEQR